MYALGLQALLVGVGEPVAESPRQFHIAGLRRGLEGGDILGRQGADRAGDALVLQALLLRVGEVDPTVTTVAGGGARISGSSR